MVEFFTILFVGGFVLACCIVGLIAIACLGIIVWALLLFVYQFLAQLAK